MKFHGQNSTGETPSETTELNAELMRNDESIELMIELQQKDELVAAALDAIESLEQQKLTFERKCHRLMIKLQMRTFKAVAVSSSFQFKASCSMQTIPDKAAKKHFQKSSSKTFASS